jgi:hypothetical protein
MRVDIHRTDVNDRRESREQEACEANQEKCAHDARSGWTFWGCELRLAGAAVLLFEKNKDPNMPLKSGWMEARGLNFPTTEAFYRRGLLSDVKAASIGWMGGERPGMQFTGDGKKREMLAFLDSLGGAVL